MTYLGNVVVSGTRAIDADGYIVSETGSYIVGSTAWLERQKQVEAAMRQIEAECVRQN